MNFTPYMMFHGDCAQAFAFYAKVFGAKIVRELRFGQAPAGVPLPPNVAPDKIMHVCLERDGFRLMGGDAGRPCPEGGTPANSFVSIRVDSADEARRVAAELAEGGNFMMPPGETFFSRQFSMLVDRFGQHWMVDFPLAESELAALGR